MIEAALGRLGAMKSDLLSPATVEELTEADGAESALAILERTSFRHAVLNTKDERSPAALERELWSIAFESVSKLVKFLEGPRRECARLLTGSFELDEIRRIVRRILAGVDLPAQPSPIRLPRSISAVDPSRLAAVHTISQVEQGLKDTPYAAASEHAFRRLKGAADIFSFEQILERDYADLLKSVAGEIDGADGRSARSYIETRGLFSALRWIFRLRFGKGLSHEEALQYVPAWADLAQAVSECKTLSRAVAVARPLLGTAPAGAGLDYVDRTLRREFARWSRTELKKNFLEYASLLAFYDVRAGEVRAITAIIAAKRQGRTVREIQAYLGVAA